MKKLSVVLVSCVAVIVVLVVGQGIAYTAYTTVSDNSLDSIYLELSMDDTKYTGNFNSEVKYKVQKSYEDGNEIKKYVPSAKGMVNGFVSLGTAHLSVTSMHGISMFNLSMTKESGNGTINSECKYVVAFTVNPGQESESTQYVYYTDSMQSNSVMPSSDNETVTSGFWDSYSIVHTLANPNIENITNIDITLYASVTTTTTEPPAILNNASFSFTSISIN